MRWRRGSRLASRPSRRLLAPNSSTFSASPDFERVDRIGGFWGHPETRTFGELLIDLEEEGAAKVLIWGLLGEMGRG